MQVNEIRSKCLQIFDHFLCVTGAGKPVTVQNKGIRHVLGKGKEVSKIEMPFILYCFFIRTFKINCCTLAAIVDPALHPFRSPQHFNQFSGAAIVSNRINECDLH